MFDYIRYILHSTLLVYVVWHVSCECRFLPITLYISDIFFIYVHFSDLPVCPALLRSTKSVCIFPMSHIRQILASTQR
jgi:hypothetical protein